MTEKERYAIRCDAMNWATRTARLGEDALAILARAQLYEDYVVMGMNKILPSQTTQST